MGIWYGYQWDENNDEWKTMGVNHVNNDFPFISMKGLETHMGFSWRVAFCEAFVGDVFFFWPSKKM